MIRTLKEVYAYREMVVTLVHKDLRGRYKGSVLGFMWTFINPLFQLLIYDIVFSKLMHNAVDRYYLFLFVALIPWIFFSASMTGGSMAVLGQKSLVTKIYFPREVLPIAYVTSSFVNMLLSFVVVFAVVLVAGVPVNPLGMLTLPLVMIVEYLMALGVAMTVSAITVYFRDLEHILGIISMGMQFLSPVMYNEVTMNITGRNLTLFKLNPMYYILSAYRTILYYGEVPDLKTLLPGLAFGVVMLLAGFRIFDVLKKRFAEVM